MTSLADEILCSKDTYTWTEAMRQCLTLEGTPVGKDMNLDQIKLKQNVTIWVGNYLEYGRYVSQGGIHQCLSNIEIKSGRWSEPNKVLIMKENLEIVILKK